MSDVKSIKVEEYSLVDFVMKIQQGIRDGYEVTDQSDDAPLQIGGGFYTIMREKVKVDANALLNAWCDKVSERLHETSIDFEKDADKWDNKELGADEAYVETIEPPKEPTIDESLPKDEQVIEQVTQTPIKATQKPTRGKK